MTDPASEDGEVTDHSRDYQLALVAFIVCIYSKNHGYFIKKISFCVTHILYDSPEFAFASSARRYFAFSLGEISSQCHLLYFCQI